MAKNYNFIVLDKIQQMKPFAYQTIDDYLQLSIDTKELEKNYPIVLKNVTPKPKDGFSLSQIHEYKLIPILLKAIQELKVELISHWEVINVNDEDKTLTGGEGIVSVYATSDRTITLPSNSQQGDAYTIIRERGSSANVIVNGGGFKIRWLENNSDTYTLSKQNESVSIIGISGAGEVGWYVV